MEKESKSIDGLVAEILDTRNITKKRVKEDVIQINNPFEVLDYIDRIRTYVELNLKDSNVLTIEENLPHYLSEVQQGAIKLARQKSERDDLTGLYNRGMIEGKMDIREPKEKYTVLMLDIDHFKNINDNYGHIVGDLVLKNIARVIQENVRESFVSRYGGEEFYVELNQTDKEGGGIAAERIRKIVEEKVIDYILGDLQRTDMEGILSKEKLEELKREKITISIGVADEKQGKNPYDVRAKADAALYKAKQNGRNMVVVNGQGGPYKNFTLVEGNQLGSVQLNKPSDITK